MAALAFLGGAASSLVTAPPASPLSPPSALKASSLRGNSPVNPQAESAGWSRLAATAGAVFALAGVASNRRRAAPAAAAATSGPSVVPVADSTFAGQPSTMLRNIRGTAASTNTGRASKIVANVKQSRGMYTRWKKQDMWLKFSKTFKGRKRNVYKIARANVMKALKQKYTSRRLFKRERRTLWIMRVRANSRLHGIAYSRFICKLKESNININRKILSQLGVYDRAVFTNILQEAIPNWKELKEEKEFYSKPQVGTVEDIDNVMIPHIEKIVPELYEDDCIRFNRKVHDWGVEYTIDQGDPKVWQSLLPKMPEIQNFELPDHWLGNANSEAESTPLDLVDAGLAPGKEQDHWWKFIEMVKETRAADAEKIAKGEETWPKKDGISRADWFKEEPQSWFD